MGPDIARRRVEVVTGESVSLETEVVTTTSDGATVVIGPLRHGEHDDLFTLFAGVLERREGFPHEPPLTPATYEAVWTGEATTVIGARLVGDPGSGLATGLAGAYYLRPNFAGRAAHIANAGYVVDPAVRGKRIGRLLVEDSIRRAPAAGFDAVQFNLVFEDNPARRMYESLGWRQIGRIPQAVDGTDALIYWRSVG